MSYIPVCKKYWVIPCCDCSMVSYRSMPRNPVLTFRLPVHVFNALARERQLRHLNVSGWARQAVLDAFQRDFPDADRDDSQPAKRSASTEDPQGDAAAPETPPLRGWRACQLPQGVLGARHDDPASLPRELVGLQIEVQTNAGKRLLRWVHAVSDRSDDCVYVRDGREKP